MRFSSEPRPEFKDCRRSFSSVRSIFFQACGTKTIIVSLSDAQEILLQDLVTFTPAIFFPEAFKSGAAPGAFFFRTGIF